VAGRWQWPVNTPHGPLSAGSVAANIVCAHVHAARWENRLSRWASLLPPPSQCGATAASRVSFIGLGLGQGGD
jgi:hypothetical protein